MEGILRPGWNCWRTAVADRVAFLIDAASYFEQVHRALQRARRSVLVIGWDIDSRVRLLRNGQAAAGEMPLSLGPLLDVVARRRRELRVRILLWDYAMIYAFERQALPAVHLGWRTPRNVQIRLDGNHPLGASHHQKLVIIDDELAFVGGIDLTDNRWDTPEHQPGDPRRTNAAGEIYQPFHDLQAVVDGQAAAVLAELARARWLRATGRSLWPVSPGEHDSWPDDLQADLRDALIGVARTEPTWGSADEVREVERLFLDSIRAARRHIYIENQFLTAAGVGEELCRSLARSEGPEILFVGPRRGSGWLEQATMVVLRSRMIHNLREADVHGRLRIVHPVLAAPHADQDINVHSKVMIVDDVLARVGSANLSNRSMGLDTECDLAVQARSDVQRRGILDFRHRLLGEHLGRSPEEVAGAIAERGLIAGVERLRGAGRTLVDIEDEVPEWLEEMVPDSELVDPERPVEFDAFVATVIPREFRKVDRAPLLTRLHLWTALSALLIAWPETPLAAVLPVHRVIYWGIDSLRWPLDPLLVAGIYLLGAALPLNILAVITVFLFGGAQGLPYALGGVLLLALGGFALGRLLGPQWLRRFTRAPIDRLGTQLARARIITLAKARWVPFTSFHVINIASGAWPVSLRKFLLGVLLGVYPGTLFTVLFAFQLQRTVLHPHGWNGPLLLLLLGAMYSLTLWLHRRLTG